MRFRFAAVAVPFIAIAGCAHLLKLPHPWKPPTVAPPTFSQYHLDGWEWGEVGRIVVMPFLNESQYTRAGDEMRVAFTSELQRLGRFEVIAAPSDDQAFLAAQVHRGGGFDEAVMLNRDGALADASRNSLFLLRGERLATPPIAAGALPGVLRAGLIANGQAVEADLGLDDLRNAEAWFLGNSLHGLRQARLA